MVAQGEKAAGHESEGRKCREAVVLLTVGEGEEAKDQKSPEE